jgi:U6 snRNA-associated Sm-like protein LSm2
LFYSFFKTLVGVEVVVELKNDVAITGTLVAVDQFLNLKLQRISVVDPQTHPHLASVSNCFIRGSVVRYITLPAAKVDVQLLHDSTRIEARSEPRK